jgi:hypothetical protein
MSIAALQLEADVEATNEDVLGGGGFVLDTGLYPMVIDNAFLDKSSGGAMNINIHLKRKSGGNQVYRQTIYITSGEKKGKLPYYVGKDGKKHPLPGYSLVNMIHKITTGNPLSQVAPEKKIVKLWDFDASAEVPREVPVVTAMVGQEILVGMHKCRENKRANQNGEWVDTNEAREFNEINKVFYPDGYTVAEKAAEADEAVFVTKWDEANPSDYVRDRFKAVAGAPASGGAAPASTAAAAPDDLFDD